MNVPEVRQSLILDACVVLNLYATGLMGEILQAQNLNVFVTTRVRREALKVGHALLNATEAPELVVLEPFINSGTLQVLQLSGNEELTAFVHLARDLDDGEAECGAIAMHRGLSVATDDKKAIRILTQLSPVVACTRTSQLLHTWAERISITDAVLRETLRAIRTRARFDAPATDPLFDWWTRHS